MTSQTFFASQTLWAAITRRPRPHRANRECKYTTSSSIIVTASSEGGDSAYQHRFRFNKIFGQSSAQEDVFAHVGQPICDRFLAGFNCTIFAYGQTGSGKTFTIDGGAKKFADRGLLPRCIHYIYDQLQGRYTRRGAIMCRMH